MFGCRMTVRRNGGRSESCLRLRSHLGAKTAKEYIAVVRRRSPRFVNVQTRKLRALYVRSFFVGADTAAPSVSHNCLSSFTKTRLCRRQKTRVPPSEAGVGAPKNSGTSDVRLSSLDYRFGGTRTCSLHLGKSCLWWEANIFGEHEHSRTLFAGVRRTNTNTPLKGCSRVRRLARLLARARTHKSSLLSAAG
jgi:hypothetical protein